MRKANAQSLVLSLSPPLLEVMIKPGKSITQVYKITNEGDPVVVTAKVGEFTEDGIKIDQEPAPSVSEGFVPEKWISLLNTDISFNRPFILNAKEERQLIVRISPPKETAEKDYYRAIQFSTSPNPPSESSQTSVTENIGSPILITITSSGFMARGAQITQFQLPRIIDSFDALISDIYIKNTGNTFFHPVGKVTLTGPIGRGSFAIVPHVILTGQTKKLLTEDSLSFGDTNSLKLPGFFLGKYKLELDFTLDEGTIRVNQSKNFYAIPWKAGMILIIGVIGVIWVMRILKKRRNR
ncbi:hypothetical protein HZB96_02755 [Candidatus Gottesmanbacteria bacterium]|nr:hypothetical protein [Candidatus Gottesmanbacteria bacterium]